VGKNKEFHRTPLNWRLRAFPDSFQKLYERFQQCVVKDGDYFEGQKVN
jgi:hypothetical protein